MLFSPSLHFSGWLLNEGSSPLALVTMQESQLAARRTSQIALWGVCSFRSTGWVGLDLPPTPRLILREHPDLKETTERLTQSLPLTVRKGLSMHSLNKLLQDSWIWDSVSGSEKNLMSIQFTEQHKRYRVCNYSTSMGSLFNILVTLNPKRLGGGRHYPSGPQFR